jgi:hypothetical protein
MLFQKRLVPHAFTDMKQILSLLPVCVFLLIDPTAHAANSDVGDAIVRQFGEAQLKNVVLVTASANEIDPVQWKVYARDPYREGELLLSIATKTGGQWDVAPAGAGRLLKRVPPQRIDFKRLKTDSVQARRIAAQAASLAQVKFSKMSYQLAANESTGVPEWGLALLDETGYEVGFCVVSGQTGALVSQDWTPKFDPPPSPSRPMSQSEKEGAEAAKRVKQGARKAWDWTEDAGRKTGSFFRELFR